MSRECELCKKKEKVLGLWKSLSSDEPSVSLVAIKDKVYCEECGRKYIEDALSKIQLTTTNSIDDYKVKRYIDIHSVEIVIGTGVFSEFTGEISDFFGQRSTTFEKKLQEAKKAALDKLKYRAFEQDGNAVIGIDLDYTEFSGNRIGLIANGTIVEIIPING